MLKMSFYDGTLNRDEAKRYIRESGKPCRYTSGLEYRNPTTNKAPVTYERACELIDRKSWVNVVDRGDYIHINSYEENDMW